MSARTQCLLTTSYNSKNVYYMGSLRLQATQGHFYKMKSVSHPESASTYVFQSPKGTLNIN